MTDPYRQPTVPSIERQITIMQWIDGFPLDHAWVPYPPAGKGWGLRHFAALPVSQGGRNGMPVTALLFFVWEREKEM